VPAEELTDRVDLVIVTTMRKAGDLSPKIIKPRRPLRQPNMPSLDAGRLRKQTGNKVKKSLIPGFATLIRVLNSLIL
jgi:hypothetical protein